MTEYRKMYAMLCAAVSAAIDELENIPLAWRSCRSRLQAALLQAEELYIDTTLGEAETEDI